MMTETNQSTSVSICAYLTPGPKNNQVQQSNEHTEGNELVKMYKEMPACKLPDKKKILELQSVLKEEPNGESYKASMIYWALAMHQVAGRAPKIEYP